MVKMIVKAAGHNMRKSICLVITMGVEPKAEKILKEHSIESAERCVLPASNPYAKICDLATQTIAFCERLNQLTSERASVWTYLDEYKNLKELSALIRLERKRHGEAIKPLANLLTGIIDFYAPFGYWPDSDFRSLTHTSRWPEFKTLLEVECKLLSGCEPENFSQQTFWKQCHAVTASIKHDSRNMAQPWDYGDKQDPNESFRLHRFRDALTVAFGHLYILRSLEKPTTPFASSNNPLWDSAFDNFVGSCAALLSSGRRETTLAAFRSLQFAGYTVKEWFRPECFCIHDLTLELFEGYIQELDSCRQKGSELSKDFSEACEKYRAKIQQLQDKYFENHWYKGRPFNHEEFDVDFRHLVAIKDQALASIGSRAAGPVIAQINKYQFNEKGLELTRDQIIDRVVAIEAERTNNGDSNAFKAAAGREELLELFNRSSTHLFLNIQHGKIEGFGFLGTSTHSIDEELKPLVDSARKERGDVGFSIIYMVAMSKAAHPHAYKQMIFDLSSCSERHHCRVSVGWTRETNEASVAHMHYFDRLPGFLEINDHGDQVRGIKFARVNDHRGIHARVPKDKSKRLEVLRRFRQNSA